MKIIVLDCETGGLKRKDNPITEIAMILYEVTSAGLIEKERYESLVKPYEPYTELNPKAVEKTGLTLEKLMASGKDVKVVFEAMKTLFKSCKPKPVIAGHNVSFDVGFIDELFKFHKTDLSTYVSSNNGVVEMIDTMKLAQMANFPKHNLTAVCEHFEIELINAHRAMNDVEATAQALECFMKIMGGKLAVTGTENEQQKSRLTFQM